MPGPWELGRRVGGYPGQGTLELTLMGRDGSTRSNPGTPPILSLLPACPTPRHSFAVGDRPHCSCFITSVTPTAPNIGSALFLSRFAGCVSRHRLAHPLFWPHPAPVYLGAWARALPAALRPPFCPVKLLPARLQAEVECQFPQSLSDSPDQLPGPSAPAVLSLLGEAGVASFPSPLGAQGLACAWHTADDHIRENE